MTAPATTTDGMKLGQEEFEEALDLLARVARAGEAPQRANVIVALGVLAEQAPDAAHRARAAEAIVEVAALAEAEGGGAVALAARRAAWVSTAAAAEEELRRLPALLPDARRAAARLAFRGGPSVDRPAALRLSLLSQGEALGLRALPAATLASARLVLNGWKEVLPPLLAASLLAALVCLGGLFALAARLPPPHTATLSADWGVSLATALGAALAAALLAAPRHVVAGAPAWFAEAAKVAIAGAVAVGAALLLEQSELGPRMSTWLSGADLRLMALAAVGAGAARLACAFLPAPRHRAEAVAVGLWKAGGVGTLVVLLAALALVASGNEEVEVTASLVAGADPDTYDLFVPGLPPLAVLAVIAALAAGAGSSLADERMRGADPARGYLAPRRWRAPFWLALPAAMIAVAVMGRLPASDVSVWSVVGSPLRVATPPAPDCSLDRPEARFDGVRLGEYRLLPNCRDRGADLAVEWGEGERNRDLELFVVTERGERRLHRDDPDPPQIRARASELEPAPLYACLQEFRGGRCEVVGTEGRRWTTAAVFAAAIGRGGRSGPSHVTETSLLADRPDDPREQKPAGDGGYVIAIRFLPRN